MNQLLREHKQNIRSFMQKQYSDEKLAQLLDHARSGQLSYWSCCCFIGRVNSNHEPQGMNLHILLDILPREIGMSNHLVEARMYNDASLAEQAFSVIGKFKGYDFKNREHVDRSDAKRRRIIIPMILAEIKRRHRNTDVQMESHRILESQPSPVL